MKIPRRYSILSPCHTHTAISALQQARYEYTPVIPAILRQDAATVQLTPWKLTAATGDGSTHALAATDSADRSTTTLATASSADESTPTLTATVSGDESITTLAATVGGDESTTTLTAVGDGNRSTAMLTATASGNKSTPPLSSPTSAIRAAYPRTAGARPLQLTAGANPAAHKKRRCGVLLSGGQAPGGHNVIAGLFDGLTGANPQSQLYGFVGGPGGFLRGDARLLAKSDIDRYRNTGGFDIIGSDRTKIESEEQLAAAMRTTRQLQLDSLVVIGGDDSNTNAALLAERFAASGLGVQVIGVPKTIDGDLKNEYIEASFGFDTATKAYSALIGDVARDTSSSRKYWNFIKLMGRSASHIALECALQTHPNVCLIGEEIAARQLSLKRIIYDICRVIAARAERGDNFGVILIPEGIVEFIPETAALIRELNHNWRDYEHVFSALTTLELKKKWLVHKLSPAAYATLCALPDEIAEQFLGLRDPHGNILVSQIETEKLFMTMTADSLRGMAGSGSYKGTFHPISQFYGYEGRAVAPSNFDANYCYALGRAAFLLLAGGATGYLACVKNLAAPAAEWTAGGIPLTALMQLEERKGVQVPVIAKALVDLHGAPFRAFAAARDRWALETDYVYPGAIQYFGADVLCNRISETLRLEAEAAGKRSGS